MFNRLGKIRFKIDDNDSDYCKLSVPLGYPNMSYVPESHSIAICPAATNMHPEYILRTLAHEIGHVLHPCRMALPLVQTIPIGPAQESCFESSYGDRDELAALQRRMDDSRFKLEPDLDRVSKLESCDIVKRLKNHSYSGSPGVFRALQACLDKTYGAVRENMINEDVRKAKKDQPSIPDAKLRESITSYVESARCLQSNQEHFADAFSAAVMAKLYEKSRPASTDIRAGLSENASSVCMERIYGPGADSATYPPALVRFQTAILSIDPALSECQPPSNLDVCSLATSPVDTGTTRVGLKKVESHTQSRKPSGKKSK
jgi:hypothetical protein